MVVTTERKSKEERREEILDAALESSPSRACTAPRPRRSPGGPASRSPTSSGSSGRRRSSSSPVVARCFRQTLEMFQRAAEGKRGEEALHAIGEAYGELLADRPHLPAGPDAGVRRLRRPRDLRGRPQRLRRPRHLRRARLGRRARRTISAFFAERDAAERARLDGPATDRAVGAAARSRAASPS